MHRDVGGDVEERLGVVEDDPHAGVDQLLGHLLGVVGRLEGAVLAAVDPARRHAVDPDPLRGDLLGQPGVQSARGINRGRVSGAPGAQNDDIVHLDLW